MHAINETSPCSKCRGSLHITVERAGCFYAEECECKGRIIALRRLHSAQIPARFECCALGDLDDVPSASMGVAFTTAESFIAGYPVTTKGRGLLLTGSIGVGKSHLAALVLKTIIMESGAKGLFVDHGEMLARLKNTMDRNSGQSYDDVLRQFCEVDVLLIDDLGAPKFSEWGFDQLAEIIRVRYNGCKTTLATSNLPCLPPRAAGPVDGFRGETLGDRIGERVRSRLVEMCRHIDVQGEDRRRERAA